MKTSSGDRKFKCLDFEPFALIGFVICLCEDVDPPDQPAEPEKETIPEPPGDGWIKDYNPFEPEADPGAQERFNRMMEE